MTNYTQYEADPSYAIRTRLAEYYELISECDEYGMMAFDEIEQELKEAIHSFCTAAEDEFDDLVAYVHSCPEDEMIDIGTVEDIVLSISNVVRLVCERRENWSKIYQQMDNDDCGVSVVNLHDILSYHPYQQYDSTEDYDERNERERVQALKQKATQIYQYIVGQKQPVSKEKLSVIIPNYSDRALALAVSHSDILNYRGLYFSIEQINVTSQEVYELCEYLLEKLEDGEVCHVDDLYGEMGYKFSSLLSRAYVQSPYQLFSLIEGLLTGSLEFSRPFIALPGVHIKTPQEYLSEYVSNSTEILVSDFVAYAKEKHIKVNSILELIVSLNDLVLLKNRETLIRISETGITNQVAQSAVQIITEEVLDNACIAIRDLTCLHKLPPIELPWDEWLIYSVIRKWGKRLNAHTTSSQFKQSVPVVALPGAATEDRIAEIAKRCSDLAYSPSGLIINNLDDLDDLILGYIDLDVDLELDFD